MPTRRPLPDLLLSPEEAQQELLLAQEHAAKADQHWESFVHGVHASMLAFARRLSLEPRGAVDEDIAQEVLTRTLAKLRKNLGRGQFRPVGLPQVSVLAWLREVMRHEHIDELRREHQRQRRQVSLDALDQLPEALVDPVAHSFPEEHLLAEMLHLESDVLTERELVVSVLGMYGLDDDRISSWLHLSTENVRQIRHRARRKIQNARN